MSTKYLADERTFESCRGEQLIGCRGDCGLHPEAVCSNNEKRSRV